MTKLLLKYESYFEFINQNKNIIVFKEINYDNSVSCSFHQISVSILENYLIDKIFDCVIGDCQKCDKLLKEFIKMLFSQIFKY